jgi:hypothetical protein
MLRVLAVDNDETGPIWHLAAYSEFFPDVETAESAAAALSDLTVNEPHLALTNRAFESTQVARIANAPLGPDELAFVEMWRMRPGREVSDRSVRLMLGLR